MYDIVAWLSDSQPDIAPLPTITPPIISTPTTSRKRLRIESLLTPEGSIAAMDATSGADTALTPRKRARRPGEAHQEDTTDTERTPRISTSSLPFNDTQSRGSSRSRASTTTSSTTNNSRRSPTKQLMRLEIVPDPVLVKQMDFRAIPTELRNMVIKMESFNRGDRVVPGYLKPDITAAQPNDVAFYNFGETVFATKEVEEDEQRCGFNWRRLSLSEIMDCYLKARNCHDQGHAESAWNGMVHWAVFEMALGGLGTSVPTTIGQAGQTEMERMTTGVTPSMVPSMASITNEPGAQTRTATGCQGRDWIKVIPMICSSARITGKAKESRMIDFCLALECDPESDFDINRDGGDTTRLISQAIHDLRLRTPANTVNHTDYRPLSKTPLVLSAESKIHGEGAIQAGLQVGVWQAAHWGMLQQQCRSSAQHSSRAERGGPADPGRSCGFASSADPYGKLPPFLPGLIIQGHRWYFVASTRDDSQTTLWTERQIGATDSVLGFFQIIYALRHIAVWSATVYWPWYRTYILGVH
ncbi:putative PD-(D/E)XK nuclease-like domain-containing protein [Seiridium cardinale]